MNFFSSRLLLICESLVFIACILVPSRTHGEEVRFLTFAESSPGLTPPRWVGEVYINPARAAQVMVVDANQNPPNPFSSYTSALFVENDSNYEGRFMLRARPFVETTPKGEIEFDFALKKGSMTISLGNNPEEHKPRNDQALIYGGENSVMTLDLSAGLELRIGKERYVSESTSVLETDQPYRLKVVWDLNDPNPYFSLFLNGEPLKSSKDGEVMITPKGEGKANTGVNSFSIVTPTKTASAFFIGEIRIGNGTE